MSAAERFHVHRQSSDTYDEPAYIRTVGDEAVGAPGMSAALYSLTPVTSDLGEFLCAAAAETK